MLIEGTQQPLSAIVPKLDQTVPARRYRLEHGRFDTVAMMAMVTRLKGFILWPLFLMLLGGSPNLMDYRPSDT